MRQRPTKKHTLTLRKETLRNLEQRALSGEELAQVAGGTQENIPRKSCTCYCRD